MSQPTDLVIPAAPKDYGKLKYVIPLVRKFIDVETIHIITPEPVTLPDVDAVYHGDDDVLPYDRTRLGYRPDWIFQQLLKIFQDVTENDWFLVVDADVFVCRHIPLWTTQGNPILNLGRNQQCAPYFNFNEQLLGFGREYPWSFLSECTLYNKQMVRDMLQFCALTMDEFWEVVVDITSPECHMGDAEFYGSYIVHEHPERYELRNLHATFRGRHSPHVWTNGEIHSEIADIQKHFPSAHLIALHSWE